MPVRALAAERVGVDQFWVLRNLRRNAIMSMRHGARAAANRSIELIGKHLGMFIERKQIDLIYVDDADEYLAKIIALVDGKVIDNEPAPSGPVPSNDEVSASQDIHEHLMPCSACSPSSRPNCAASDNWKGSSPPRRGVYKGHKPLITPLKCCGCAVVRSSAQRRQPPARHRPTQPLFRDGGHGAESRAAEPDRSLQ
jgi:hypothetical protein